MEALSTPKGADPLLSLDVPLPTDTSLNLPLDFNANMFPTKYYSLKAHPFSF